MGRIVGLDYGERRLGFAVSDPTHTIASALAVETVTSTAEAATTAARICREQEAERLVIGFPWNMNGTPGPMGERVSGFKRKLEAQIDVPIELWDERLTTKTAEDVLIEGRTTRAKRKHLVDKVAAQIMLQHYLDTKSQRDDE